MATNIKPSLLVVCDSESFSDCTVAVPLTQRLAANFFAALHDYCKSRLILIRPVLTLQRHSSKC